MRSSAVLGCHSGCGFSVGWGCYALVNDKHCITHELALCFHYPVQLINLQWHFNLFNCSSSFGRCCILLLWCRLYSLEPKEQSYSEANSCFRSFRVCSAYQVLSGWSYQGGWDGQGMLYAWEQRGMHAGFRCENLMEGDNLEGLDVDGRPIWKWILKNGMGEWRQDWSGLDGDLWVVAVNIIAKQVNKPCEHRNENLVP